MMFPFPFPQIENKVVRESTRFPQRAGKRVVPEQAQPLIKHNGLFRLK